MNEKINPVRETNEKAMSLVSTLLIEARYGALGVEEPETAVPLVSRVAVAWSQSTGLFFAASDLSVHSKSLKNNSTCSIMLGEVGKGDGLAYPRVTLVGNTARMSNDNKNRARYRLVFLDSHPKAKLYIDFADFGFYPINMVRALLNGGFGQAYHLNEKDLSLLSG
ncbi:MAG: HugZ family protein [Rhizobiaceae bacterium]